MNELERFGRLLELEGRRRAHFHRRVARAYGRISCIAFAAAVLSLCLAVWSLFR